MEPQTHRLRLAVLPLLALYIAAAACITAPGTPTFIDASTPSPSATETLQADSTATAAPPIQFFPWPEQGSLLLPPDLDVTFDTSLDELPPGGYVLTWDNGPSAGQIQAVSFDTGEVTVLAEIPDPDFDAALGSGYFGGSMYVSPVIEPNGPLQVLDLSEQRTWRLADLCPSISEALSPSGRYFLAPCEGQVIPGLSSELDLFDVISVTDGTGFRVALPSKDERNPVALSWFGEDDLIASSVWVDDRFFVCLISVEAQMARCPYSFEEPYFVAQDVLIGGYLPFVLSQNGHRQGVIMPRDCLVRGECDGTVELGEIPGLLYGSPSGEAMALIGYDAPLEHALVGFLEPPAWERGQLLEMPEAFLFDGWCPDETCILLEESGWPRPSHRLHPDGILSRFPYDNIIASFNVP